MADDFSSEPVLNNYDVSDDRSSKPKQSSVGRAAANASRELNRQSVQQLQDLSRVNLTREDETPRMTKVPSFKRGGTVRKSGAVRLHAGERVKGRKKSRKSGRY
jgi:hypothetical protein